MSAINPLGYILWPRKQWELVSNQPLEKYNLYILYPLLLAVIPTVAWYHGVTEIGWTVDDGEVIKLTPDSAFKILIAFHFTIIASVIVIGYMTHWMSATYGAETSAAKGIAIAGFVCTPLFLAGAVGFYPLLWLDLALGVVAVSWSVYLLYVGIPIAMRLPPERGFLYASAVISVALVILVCILVGSVILWDFGAGPVFTD
jgi:hypothetical protein